MQANHQRVGFFSYYFSLQISTLYARHTPSPGNIRHSTSDTGNPFSEIGSRQPSDNASHQFRETHFVRR
jgi:hypothetical protein